MTKTRSARFSLGWFMRLLVVNGSLVALLATVGILGFAGAVMMMHVAETYRGTQISSVPIHVSSDVERFLRAEANALFSAAAGRTLTGADFAAHPAVAAVVHRDEAARQWRFVLATASVTVADDAAADWSTLWQRACAAVPEGGGAAAGTESVGPAAVPAGVDWHARAVVNGGSPMFAVLEVPRQPGQRGQCGLIFAGAALTNVVMKVLRQNCTDNYMYVSLLTAAGDACMTVTSHGLSTPAAAQVRGGQGLATEERALGGVFAGWRVRVNYPPGLFARVSERVIYWFVAVLGMLALLIIGIVVSTEIRAQTSAHDLELRNDWVLNLAHTLRGPVHSLGILSEALVDPAAAAESRPTLVGLIRRELEIMDSTYRRFVRLAQSDKNALTLLAEPVDLAPVAMAVRERLLGRYPAFPADRVTLQIPAGLRVAGDPQAVREVLETMLDNALKYSPQLTPVRVVAGMEGTRVHLTVIDQGIGIASRDLVRVGEAFFRGGAQGTDGIVGTGLGVYLAQGLCAAMGGTFTVGSAGVGKGATATAVLPHA